MPKYVTTITPQRISFFGGGTDLPDYYKKYGGSVISSTINQYVYVTVKKHSSLFNEQYRLNYSKTEHVDSLDEIENGIARECLKILEIDPPIYIATTSDLPASSGLGSSSSFAVGLLNALHYLKGEQVSPGQLADEACEVEINRLKNPIVKQDQYAAAFGGINHIHFEEYDRVKIDQINPQNDAIRILFENSVLFWTEIQRDSGAVLKKQGEKINELIDCYHEMKEDVLSCKEILLNPSENFLEDIGKLLEQSWARKKALEESISNDK